MPTKTLSQKALDVIYEYLNLKIGDETISCSYFNNDKNKLRGALRVLIGKGRASEISEEVQVIAKREHIDLADLRGQELKKFLVEHNLGIDCSGLVFYILEAEFASQGRNLKLNFLSKNFLRKIIARFRKIENTSVRVLAHDVNSRKINLVDIEPGDMIVMIDFGESVVQDHVVIVHQVKYDESDKPVQIYYTHSLSWRIDGRYNHGVRQGVIQIRDLEKNLLEQKWIEQEKEGEENETLERARKSRILEIRRMK